MNLDQLLRETSSVATPQSLPPWSPPADVRRGAAS